MRIKWSGDVARDVVRQLEEIEQMLAGCVREAMMIRTDLDNANLGRNNRRLSAINNRYEASVRGLKRLENEVEELAEAAKQTMNSFEDAESRVYSLMNALEDTANTEQGSHTTAPQVPSPETNEEDYITWQLPEPIIMPGMRVGGFPIPTEEWLVKLLMKMQ